MELFGDLCLQPQVRWTQKERFEAISEAGEVLAHEIVPLLSRPQVVLKLPEKGMSDCQDFMIAII